MTEINNRIEEVKRQKLQHLWCQHCKALQKSNETVVECWYNPLDAEGNYAFCAANEDAIAQICQLFPQPLEGKEWERAFGELLTGKEINKALGYPPRPAPQASSTEVGSAIFVAKAQYDKDFALLQPKIEEARKAGFDDGVKKTTIAMDSTFDAQLDEARKQERERILRLFDYLPEGMSPDVDKFRQILKGGSE